ncbi:hypothetical protein C8R43DRAFT_253702 [Mycena crocata]|nr:hypothetical protein C8R43DRAFT_253702 [Mycena crocata]
MSSPSTKGRTGSIRVGELLNPTSAKDFLKPTVSMIEIALNKPLREEDSTFTLGGVDWGSGGRAQSSTSLSAAGPLHQYQMSPRALSPNTIARPLWPQDVSMAYGAPPDSVQHSAQRTATLGSYTPGMPAPAAYQQPAFPQHQKQQSRGRSYYPSAARVLSAAAETATAQFPLPERLCDIPYPFAFRILAAILLITELFPAATISRTAAFSRKFH